MSVAGIHGMRTGRLVALLAATLTLLLCEMAPAQPGAPRIGLSDGVFLLHKENTDARGIAFHAAGSEGPRLFVLDRKQKIFAYRVPVSERVEGALELLETFPLPERDGLQKLLDPRGLAVEMAAGSPTFYFLDWQPQGDQQALLVQYDTAAQQVRTADLTQHPFRIGDREPADVALGDDGRVLVCFDSSGYADPDLRVQRGLIEIRWPHGLAAPPGTVRHLPDAGTEPSRALTWMDWEGARYLWATVGDESIYCADAATGRGLFFFDRPAPGTGMAYGDGWLWVAAGVRGPDRIHRVNVIRNPDAHYAGPRVLRRLVMQIRTTPCGTAIDAGAVYHNYSRPAHYELLLRQGIWPETEMLVDEAHAPNATLETTSLDPAGDIASRQTLRSVVYASAPAREYSSRYEIDIWTSPFRKYVYPHRANSDTQALGQADYLADDPELYGLADHDTYRAFLRRVNAHIESKYGVPADMGNPYWAARNVVEYIQDNYYYPSREKGRPASVDYDRQHYDANPANLKLELSGRPYDQTQIIACSGTSVMVAGAMRFAGIPARWLGTGTPVATTRWDRNSNGLLDDGERQDCTNGHRYTQVWLGSHYGWICFDATPSKPPANDYDVPPPRQSQWRFMTRAAGGHRYEDRIVFNVGAELIRALYRDFEFDQQLAIDNNCGGDQRYNLQGRFEQPAHWNLPAHSIQVTNPCSLEVLEVSGSVQQANVRWRLQGPWERVPDATLSICLQQLGEDGRAVQERATLARQVPASQGQATVSLSGHTGSRLRLILRRDGDPLTGGVSSELQLTEH